MTDWIEKAMNRTWEISNDEIPINSNGEIIKIFSDNPKINELLKKIQTSKNHRETIEYCAMINVLDPDFIYAYYKKSLAYYELKEHDEAIRCCKTGLEKNDKRIDFEFGLAWYNKCLKKYEEAIDCCDRSLEIDPNRTRVLALKAGILANQEKYEEAIDCCDKALVIEPTTIILLKIKISILIIDNKYEQAIGCYDKALAIEPNDEELQRERQDVLKIISMKEKLRELRANAAKLEK